MDLSQLEQPLRLGSTYIKHQKLVKVVSMAGITGIGSGLDINNIVKAMVEAETAPKAAQLSRLEKTTTTKISALGSLKGALSNFQTTIKDLNKISLFEKRTATSSDTNVLNATANKTALSGSYTVAVQQLASSSKVATIATKDFSSTVAGNLTVSLGANDDSAVSVNIAAGASLVEIRDALNDQLKDKGINANIVNNPSTGYSQLVFSAKETGAGKNISVLGSGGNLANLSIDSSVKAGDGTAGFLAQATNAKFTIDGLNLESASNTIDDAISDVSFTLKNTTEINKPLTLSVGQDNSGVKEQLAKFVDSYNELMKVAKAVTNVTPVGEGKQPVTGGLVGDSTVRNLLNGIRGEISNTIGTNSGGLRILSDLGIAAQKDGTLKIDDEKLTQLLETDFDAVAQFVAGDSGLMTRMDQRIGTYVEAGGVLEQRIKSLTTTTSSIASQREVLMRRTEQIEARLFKQFNAMDALVGQLSSTSQSIMQSLNNLPGVSRKD